MFTWGAVPVAVAHGPKATFWIVVLADAVLLVFSVILSCCGKIKTI